MKALHLSAHALLVGFALSLVAGCKTAPPTVETGKLKVLAVDVGSGLCVLVRCPNGNVVLNDCGTLEKMDSQKVQSAIQLVKGTIDGLDKDEKLYVLTSHADKDHVLLIPKVVDDNAIKNHLVAYYQNVEDPEYRKKLGDWLKKVEAAGKRMVTLKKITDRDRALTRIPYLDCGGPGGPYLLANDIGNNPNDRSAVVLYDGGAEGRVLTTGDAEGATLDFLMKKRTKFIKDQAVLIAPHHGSSNDTNSEQWAKASSPKIVFFSAGENGQYGHPRCAVVDRYETLASRLTTSHLLDCFDAQRTPGEQRSLRRAQFNTRNSGALFFYLDLTTTPVERVLQTCTNNVLDPRTCTTYAKAGPGDIPTDEERISSEE